MGLCAMGIDLPEYEFKILTSSYADPKRTGNCLWSKFLVDVEVGRSPIYRSIFVLYIEIDRSVELWLSELCTQSGTRERGQGRIATVVKILLTIKSIGLRGFSIIEGSKPQSKVLNHN